MITASCTFSLCCLAITLSPVNLWIGRFVSHMRSILTPSLHRQVIALLVKRTARLEISVVLFSKKKELFRRNVH